jgi:hypothetical protein
MTTKRTWGKVAVGTRLNDRCDPLFFNCWGRLLTSGMRAGDRLLDAGVELPQHFAAVVVARNFLATDADSLLMVDTDMIFTPDTLSRLRDAEDGQEYDVLSALSVVRRRPFHPIVLRLRQPATPGPCAYECIKLAPGDGVLEVDSVGTGFTLIRRSVFDRMRAELGIDRWYFDWMPGGGGEDTMFCQNARRLGMRIGVDCRVGIGHRGPMTFGWDMQKQEPTLEAYDQVHRILGE